MPRHVRKGDLVIVISGKAKGRTGRILRLITNPDPNRVRLIVEGVNVRKKHVRPTQTNQRGGIIEKEMPIHISNVAPVSDGKATRVRFETKADGAKVRIGARTGQQIGQELYTARD